MPRCGGDGERVPRRRRSRRATRGLRLGPQSAGRHSGSRRTVEPVATMKRPSSRPDGGRACDADRSKTSNSVEHMPRTRTPRPGSAHGASGSRPPLTVETRCRRRQERHRWTRRRDSSKPPHAAPVPRPNGVSAADQPPAVLPCRPRRPWQGPGRSAPQALFPRTPSAAPPSPPTSHQDARPRPEPVPAPQRVPSPGAQDSTPSTHQGTSCRANLAQLRDRRAIHPGTPGRLRDRDLAARPALHPDLENLLQELKKTRPLHGPAVSSTGLRKATIENPTMLCGKQRETTATKSASNSNGAQDSHRLPTAQRRPHELHTAASITARTCTPYGCHSRYR